MCAIFSFERYVGKIIIIIFMVDGFQFRLPLVMLYLSLSFCVCTQIAMLVSAVNWQHICDERVSMYKLACLMFIQNQTDYAVIGNYVCRVRMYVCMYVVHMNRTSSWMVWESLHFCAGLARAFLTRIAPKCDIHILFYWLYSTEKMVSRQNDFFLRPDNWWRFAGRHVDISALLSLQISYA